MTSREYLQHWGILGMKWGKKKGKKKTPVKIVKTSASDDHLTKEQLKSKPLKEMTNKEIRSFTERVQLEKQYADLTKKEVSKGRKFVNEFLLNPIKEVASRKAKELVAKQMEDAISKMMTRR
jgi:hypothetical protein